MQSRVIGSQRHEGTENRSPRLSNVLRQMQLFSSARRMVRSVWVDFALRSSSAPAKEVGRDGKGAREQAMKERSAKE